MDLSVAKAIAAAVPDPELSTISDVFSRYIAVELPRLNWKLRPQIKSILNIFATDFGPERTVKSIRRFEVVEWLTSKANWKSPWVRKRIVQQVGRAFSWAISLELAVKNPFHKAWSEWAPPGHRPATDDEFRALMRVAPAHLRRLFLFLRFTGCRPNEACRLKWANVDLNRSACALREHKTARKTQRPRVIFLPPPLVKMLRSMQQGQRPLERHAGRLNVLGAARLMRRVLLNGAVTTREMRERMQAAGVSVKTQYRAAAMIGSSVVQCGRNAIDLYLPPTKANHTQLECPTLNDFVFCNERGRCWTNYSLQNAMKRFRLLTNLPKDFSLYCFRHAYATEAILRDVPMKCVSTLLGHSRCATTEAVYIAVQSHGFHEMLLDAASKAIQKLKGGRQ